MITSLSTTSLPNMSNTKRSFYKQLRDAIPAYHKFYDELLRLLNDQRKDDVYVVDRQYI